jgi:hypothetical protein
VTRTLNFNPSPADTWLEIGEVPRASPLTLTGPAADGYESYSGALWRNPRSVHAAGATPLATADGSVGVGTASLEFSATDLDLDLTADAGYYDDIWLVVTAVRESQTEAVRWGWLRLVEAGLESVGTIGAPLVFTITDDLCSITHDGLVYTLAVVLVGPSEEDEGVVTASNDVLYFHTDGEQWSAPAVQVVPAVVAEGEGAVLDDVLYVTLAGLCYATPVVSGGVAAEAPGSTLVTGSDGAEYIRTVFSDGTVRYSPVYETLP